MYVYVHVYVHVYVYIYIYIHIIYIYIYTHIMNIYSSGLLVKVKPTAIARSYLVTKRGSADALKRDSAQLKLPGGQLLWLFPSSAIISHLTHNIITS